MSWTSLGTIASKVLCALLALSIPVSTLSARSEGLAGALNAPDVFLSELSPCPAVCPSHDPQDWTVYGSFDRFSLCHEPIIFDFAIHTPVDDPSKVLKFRACTAKDEWYTTANVRAAVGSGDSLYDGSLVRQSKVTLQIMQQTTSQRVGVSSDNIGGKGRTALAKVREYLNAGTDCTKNIILGYYDGMVVGVYAGQAFGKGTVPSAIDELLSKPPKETSAATLLQLCGKQRDADHVFGIAISPAADLAAVQVSLVSWSKGECVAGAGDMSPLSDISIWEVPQGRRRTNSVPSNATVHSDVNVHHGRRLLARDTKYCQKTTIVKGDTCTSLAKSCGITLEQFYEYNSKEICGNLQVDSKVCCTEGFLTPQPYDNGTCYTYTTQPDDNCYTIGLTWSLKTKDLEGFNDGTTWGWNGCDNLGAGQNICLSKGSPPMPAVLPNAICGPQAPGTALDGPITNASDLAELNPCPLNSCCNIWGQCGIDSDFCIESRGPTGNPGTSKPGLIGCVSNCGTEIVNNENGPADGYQRVGYYESYNWDRECLHMRAEWSNTLDYTHMHWAFGSIREDLSVYVNDSYSQWKDFMELKDVKRIVSFGGWGFSTELSTWNILRKAMEPENRKQFISNLISFAEETGIDGIDIDWEYPGAPDIPGTPPGLKSDAPNYLATLKALRAELPDKYSLSIAAPASYWYLKAFPISDIAEVVDYIVYMAYDLHGQWDYGNMYAQSGCPSGNCLRSHVNETEVELALAMITKAGVHSDKIMVGESSYGRSFKMAEAGCTGPNCFFTGTNGTSKAKPGRCTGAGGYLANAEIKEIIQREGGSVQTWYDEETATDYMVYDGEQVPGSVMSLVRNHGSETKRHCAKRLSCTGLEWVGYMGFNTKQERRDKWKRLNFRGTIDWAVDLQDFNIADTVGPTGEYNKSSCINVFDNMIWDWANPVIAAPIDCTNLIQASPLATTVTRTAYTTITLVSGHSLRTTVVSTAFPISEVNYQPFTIASTDTGNGSVLTYTPIPRVTPSPLAVTMPKGWTITSPGGEVDGPSSTTDLVGLPTSTPTTTSSDGAGFIVFVTWQPTVSYSLPSVIKPKVIAPVTIPVDDNSPTPTPEPGVVDCVDDSCTEGPDCTHPECTRGGDCTGPHCTRGGDCIGPACVRGGVCIGPYCEIGGKCEGDDCVAGGGCSGPKCHQGGECSGPHCTKGGGCVNTPLKNCSPGPCTGTGCNIDCPGCDNQIVITVQPGGGNPPPTPKPTCLSNCPTYPPCADGGSSCNQPCNVARCPPESMPTDKACTSFTTANDCTEFVSSTKVQTTPTASYSTTTRTRCETVVDCDVQDMTRTTTITTSEKPDPTAKIEGIYDYENDSLLSQDELNSLGSEYDEWERTADHPITTTTTTTSSTSTETTSTTTTNPHTPGESSTTCGHGQTMCHLFVSNLHGFCDMAKSFIRGGDLYGTIDGLQTGECYTDDRHAGGGCGVFIKGEGCAIKGTTMQAAYDHIFQNCDHACGHAVFDNGCVMKVDYVSGCPHSNS